MKRIGMFVNVVVVVVMMAVISSRSEKVSFLVPPSPLHAIHGSFVSSDDTHLYVGSLIGERIYDFDLTKSPARYTVIVFPPRGEADDVVMSNDGRLYFTSLFSGQLRMWDSLTRKVEVLVDHMPGSNALLLDQRGRLFASQVFLGDALWELDPVKKVSLDMNSSSPLPRLICKDMGGFNGFDVDPKNPDRLCGPLWFKSEIVCIDIKNGEITTIFHQPGITFSSVNFDRQGRMFASDISQGFIYQVDLPSTPATQGTGRIVVRSSPGIDNLSVAHMNNAIYFVNMVTASIYSFNTDTYAVTTVHEGFLSGVSGLTLVTVAGTGAGAEAGVGADTSLLYVADFFSVKSVNVETKEKKVELYSYTTPSEYFHSVAVAVDLQRGEMILSTIYPGKVLIFKVEKGKYTKVAELTTFNDPMDVEFLNTNGDFLVVEQGSGTLTLVNRTTLQSKVLVSGLSHPTCLALTPDRTTAYVTETTLGAITQVDFATGKHQRVTTGLRLPEGIAVSLSPPRPAGSEATVADDKENGNVYLYLVEVGGLKKVSELVLKPDGTIDWKTLARKIKVDGPKRLIRDVVLDSRRGVLYISGSSENAILEVEIPQPLPPSEKKKEKEKEKHGEL